MCSIVGKSANPCSSEKFGRMMKECGTERNGSCFLSTLYCLNARFSFLSIILRRGSYVECPVMCMQSSASVEK